MSLLPTPCMICGDHAHVLRTDVRALCRKPACQWTFHSTPTYARCTACERPLTPPQLADRVCSTPDCQRTLAIVRREAHTARVRMARERFERRASAVRAEAAGALGIHQPEAYHLARIPHTAAPTAPLPAHRRAEYLAHLTDVVDKVFEARASGATRAAQPLEDDARMYTRPLSDEIRAVLGQGCAQCRGACCEQGGTRAFIDAPTIDRYLDAHPEHSAPEVIADYARHVEYQTFTNACVYQGATGCTLPRAMRADICNGFYCAGIRELLETMSEGITPRVFYEASTGPVTQYAFVDVRDVRVVRH